MSAASGKAKTEPRDFPLAKTMLVNQLELIELIRRKIGEKVVVVCNKCDDEETELGAEGEVFRLGFRDHVSISAQFGNNMHQIWEILSQRISQELQQEYQAQVRARKRRIKQFRKQFEDLVEDYLAEFGAKRVDSDQDDWHKTDPNVQKMQTKGRHLDKEYFLEEFDKMNKNMEFESDIDDEEVPIENILRMPRLIEEKGISFDNAQFNNKIEVAIIGRPNTGKSTLMNKWLGRNASLVDEESHTTRDTSSGEVKIGGRRLELIDTAGINKNLRQSQNEIDKMAYFKTKKKIKLAQVHVIMGRRLTAVDSMWAFREQDYDLIRKSIDEGRGIIIFINKWDLVDPSWYVKAKRFIYKDIDKNVDVKGLPIVFGSALKK